MKSLQILDHILLDRISEQACASPRRRQNFNFHAADRDLSHRLLNAVEPGTYVPPHRHLDPNKDETMILVRGSMGVILYDDAGQVVHQTILAARGPNFGINIPWGQYHSIVALESGTVFFESKAGPYVPLTKAERAPWAPQEDEPKMAEYFSRLQRHFF